MTCSICDVTTSYKLRQETRVQKQVVAKRKHFEWESSPPRKSLQSNSSTPSEDDTNDKIRAHLDPSSAVSPPKRFKNIFTPPQMVGELDLVV